MIPYQPAELKLDRKERLILLLKIVISSSRDEDTEQSSVVGVQSVRYGLKMWACVQLPRTKQANDDGTPEPQQATGDAVLYGDHEE